MPKKKKQESFPLPNELIPRDWFTRLTREEVFNNDKPIEMDLGCGDGRLLLEACGPRFGCRRGDGYELDPALAAEARRAVAAAGLGARVRIHEACAKGADLSGSSVVLLYLSERGNKELLPQLRRDLRPGARVATFAFPIPGCRPSGSARVDGISLFLYDTAALEPGGAP